MTTRGRRRSATVCVAAVVILAWCLVPTTDCLRLKKTERRGGRKEADAAKKRVQQGTIVFGRAFEKGSGLEAPVTDGNRRSNASVEEEEEEVTYQADSAGWTRGQTQDASSKEASWKRLSSSLQCGGDQLRFRAVGPGASLFALEQGNAPPTPLSQVPSTCGYSMHRNSFALVMLVPYDGCNMVQQGRNHVLPMRWQGIPVSLWCPKGVADTPIAPAAVDPAKQPEGSKYPQFPFYPPWFPHFQPPLPVTTAAPTATAAPTTTIAVPVTAAPTTTTTKSIVPAKQPERSQYPQFPFYPPWFPHFQPPLPVTAAAPTAATAAPTTATAAPVTAAPTTTKLIVPAKQREGFKYPQFPIYPPWFPYFQPPLPVTMAAPTTTTAAPTTTAVPVTSATAAPTTTKSIVPAKRPDEPPFPQFPFLYPPMFPYFHPPPPVKTAAPTTAAPTTTTAAPTTTTAAPNTTTTTAAPTTTKSAAPAKKPVEPHFPQFPLYPPKFPYFHSPQLPWPVPGSLPGRPSQGFPPYMPVYANYPPYVLPPPFPPFGFSHYQYPTRKPETVPTTTPITTTTAAAVKTSVKQSPDFQQLVYPSSNDALPFFPYGHPFGPSPF